jgi:phenylalanyl-tRNA synthetase beta chain
MPTRRIIESWLKTITSYPYTPAELSDNLMNLGIEVESIENRFDSLAGFVVGEVLSREKHANADKLSVCTVTTGGDPVTVVCGAPNVAAGQKIVFAPVGTHIPTADFTIERRKIRGVTSEGMICSEAELGLSDDHDGILVLPADAPVGAPVASILGDVIYEIEVTPNRADCLSHLGIAREIAALTGGRVNLPQPEVPESAEPASSVASVTIQDPELCPRYVARVIRGVKIGPSPEWLQEILRKLGLRPRNNVIDITNYVLFECGHPLHAFDYDRLAGGAIVVKSARAGESFRTLDGKEHQLPDGALMICDAERPVAIAGVMGGENSEIGDETVNVLLESAYFDPTSVRRTAKLLGISTDASYRFERGADINNTIYAVDRAASLIAGLAGGEVLAGRIDVYPHPRSPLEIEMRFPRTNAILGMDIPDQTQREMLRRLGFGLKDLDGRQAMVTVPSYRVDILSEIDLIEEIARLNDYNNIPAEAHASVTFDLEVHPLLKLMEDTRGFFIDSGFMETTGFYMTDPEAAAAYGTPVELRNALGRDSSMLRTSLVPGMARATALNERYGRRDLRLFEVGKAFRKGRPDQGTIPGIVEVQELAVLMSGAAEPVAWDVPARNSDIQDLRGMLDRYFARIRATDIVYNPVAESRWGIDAPALAILAGGGGDRPTWPGRSVGAGTLRCGRETSDRIDRYRAAGTPRLPAGALRPAVEVPGGRARYIVAGGCRCLARPPGIDHPCQR